MTLHLTKYYIIVLFLGLIVNLNAQEDVTDVDSELAKLKSTLKADPFDIGGSLRADLRFNAIQGMDRRANPFDFRLNGAVYITTFGFRTSLNINLSDGRVLHRFSRPDIKLPGYAFLGMSPTYKWAKLHLGYRNMKFSPYTLSGHQFYGAGMELTPGKFRLAGFYGRLQRAQAENLDLPQSLDPRFRRIGWGVKTGYQSGKDELFLVLFSAKDDPNSIDIPLDRNDVTPAENTIINVIGKKAISSIITLHVNYAWSAFTRDNRSEAIAERDDLSFIYDFGGLIVPKISTGFHKALNSKIEFNTSWGILNLDHERVDPGYRSMGALFFNNDFENITAGYKNSFLSKKLNVATKFGLQRNNLTALENNSFRRLIGQVNVNYRATEKLNLALSVSNFSTTNILRISLLPNPNDDLLILTQVNKNINFNANYIAGENKNSVFNTVLSYNQFQSITDDIINVDQVSENIMGNFSHSYKFPNNRSSITNGILVNQNINSISNLTTISPTHSYSTMIMDKKIKLKTSLSNAFLLQENQFQKHIAIARVQGTYKINKKNQFVLVLSYATQTTKTAVSDPFQEFNTRIKYQMRL